MPYLPWADTLDTGVVVPPSVTQYAPPEMTYSYTPYTPTTPIQATTPLPGSTTRTIDIPTLTPGRTSTTVASIPVQERDQPVGDIAESVLSLIRSQTPIQERDSFTVDLPLVLNTGEGAGGGGNVVNLPLVYGGGGPPVQAPPTVTQQPEAKKEEKKKEKKKEEKKEEPPVAPTPTGPVPLGPLAWWDPEQVPPLMRSWGAWLRELVQMNASTDPIPFPFNFDEEAEAAAADTEGAVGQAVGTIPAPSEHIVQEGESISTIASQHGMTVDQVLSANPQIVNPNLIYPGWSVYIPILPAAQTPPLPRERRSRATGELAPGTVPPQPPLETQAVEGQLPAGYKTDVALMRDLMEELGVAVTPEMTETQKWQEFINRIGQVGEQQPSLRAQQLATGLRYDPNKGWYSVSSPLLVNPRYT